MPCLKKIIKQEIIHTLSRKKPDQVVEIPTEERFKEDPGYVPTGNIVSRQVIGICAVERYLRDSIENEKGLTWNRQMSELIQEMIHGNNIAPAEGMAEEKTAGFEARYDAIVQAATKEYEDDPPLEYYRGGYNLYRRMAEYRHNDLLFLSNPLVEPDNNLCERKARILKGKINQAISLRSFGQLTYFCECLSVLDHFASGSMDNLYRSVKEVFERPRPVMSVSEDPGSTDTISFEYKAG